MARIPGITGENLADQNFDTQPQLACWHASDPLPLALGSQLRVSSPTSCWAVAYAMTYDAGRALTRRDIIQLFEVDCGNGLQWLGGGTRWQPGGDYTQCLKVRNCSTKVQHINYKLPASKCFFMEFPDQIKLSPGMSVDLPVSFRPVRLQVCEIHWHTSLHRPG